MQGKGKLVVITGPCGVGKSTIVGEVLRRTGAAYSVSATTRGPRGREVDGVDYHFVDKPSFERMIAAGELLEHAEVFGNYYGTPAGPVREAVAAGRTIVLEIDVQGGLQVHARCPEATFILIEPPGEAELERRLRGRGTDSPEVIARRLAGAKRELQDARDSGAYTHRIVNDDLETAVARVVDIIQKQE